MPKDWKTRYATPLAFVFGAVLGGLAVAGLSARASRTFLAVARTEFIAEQEQALRSTWRAGNYLDASVHASCLVEAEFGRDSDALSPSRSLWSLSFPFVAPILDAIRDPNITKASRSAEMAVSRAKFGAVLEQLGRSDLAEVQYAEAARIAGNSSAIQWKGTARSLLELGSK